MRTCPPSIDNTVRGLPCLATVLKRNRIRIDKVILVPVCEMFSIKFPSAKTLSKTESRNRNSQLYLLLSQGKLTTKVLTKAVLQYNLNLIIFMNNHLRQHSHSINIHTYANIYNPDIFYFNFLLKIYLLLNCLLLVSQDKPI